MAEWRRTGEAEVAAARRPGALPVVTVVRPRCPDCGSPRLRKHRSIADQGDGTAAWWVTCRSEGCGKRFRVVLE